MYIKDFDYENAAYTIMEKYIAWIKKNKEINESKGIKYIYPKTVDTQKAIDMFIPEKYLDENTTSTSYWTKHNDKKLYKYVQTEITRRKAL